MAVRLRSVTMLPRPALALVFALATALSSSLAAQEAQDTPAWEQAAARLEAALPALRTRAGVPGLALALADPTGVVWVRSSGLRDVERSLAVQDDTVFAAASLSKPLFAYLVLQLVDQGLLALDRPLAEYAPLTDLAHDPRHARLTARMILSHTTGLPNWRPRGGQLDFVADPGTRWGYSGEGYVLLQRVVEELTASDLDGVARDLVFEPLGMESASFRWDSTRANQALPHDRAGHAHAPPDAEQNAAASLSCSVGDYARFLSALLCGEGLDAQLVAELGRSQVDDGARGSLAPGVSWGLGLGLEEQPAGAALWQWGHNTGYRAFAWLPPGREFAFVFLCNGDGGMLLLRDLVNAASGHGEHPALVHLEYPSHDDPEEVQSADAREAIAAYLAGWEARGELSGVVLAARGEQVVFRGAYGLADAESGVPNTPRTKFHLASVTKTFTAAALLLLEDSGALALADPVASVLPDYPRGAEISFEQLLSHASGIPDHHGLPGFEQRTAQGIGLEELVQWQSEFPLEFEPGSTSVYGNSGYALLAHVVEVVSGQDFPDFVRANLLEPLGMSATGEVGTAGPVARGYVFAPTASGRARVPARDYSYALGSGSMQGTVDDLLAWLRAVDAQTLVDVQRTAWPYGWGRSRAGKYAVLDQTGAHAGFTATLSVVPEADVYVVHLSNLGAGLPFQRVHRDVLRILLGEEVDTPAALESFGWDPGAGARLAGLYAGDGAAEGDVPVVIEASAQGLGFAWTPDADLQHLVPVAANRFYLPADGCELRFRSPSESGALSFELHAPWSPGGPHRAYTRH